MDFAEILTSIAYGTCKRTYQLLYVIRIAVRIVDTDNPHHSLCSLPSALLDAFFRF